MKETIAKLNKEIKDCKERLSDCHATQESYWIAGCIYGLRYAKSLLKAH